MLIAIVAPRPDVFDLRVQRYNFFFVHQKKKHFFSKNHQKYCCRPLLVCQKRIFFAIFSQTGAISEKKALFLQLNYKIHIYKNKNREKYLEKT